MNRARYRRAQLRREAWNDKMRNRIGDNPYDLFSALEIHESCRENMEDYDRLSRETRDWIKEHG